MGKPMMSELSITDKRSDQIDPFEVEESSILPIPKIRPEILEVQRKDASIHLFYSMMREMRENGTSILDLGSSEKVGNVELAQIIDVIDNAHEESKTSELYTEYGSSWGTMELREAIANYFAQWGGIDLDPRSQIMVTRGIMDSIDRTIRAFQWSGMIIPDWAPYFVKSKATIHGLPIIDVPLDITTGNLELDILEKIFKDNRLINTKRLLMYITHPNAPVGTIMDDDFIEQRLIPFCKTYGITLFSDSYISGTQFDGQRLRPILSYPDAMSVCVEAITVAKEHGLPGARAGGIAGNEHIIDGIRLLATTQLDIVGGPSQILAARALQEIQPQKIGQRIKQELEKEILPRFELMAWPVLKPKAGIDMIVGIPPKFRQPEIENPSLLASITFLRRYGVGFFPCSVSGLEMKHALRIILKQKEGEIAKALDKMRDEGFNWQTEEPTAEDQIFLQQQLTRIDLMRL